MFRFAQYARQNTKASVHNQGEVLQWSICRTAKEPPEGICIKKDHQDRFSFRAMAALSACHQVQRLLQLVERCTHSNCVSLHKKLPASG